MRKLLTLLLAFFFFFLAVKPVLAQEYFTTAYSVLYTLRESGPTHVVFTVSLTNTSSQYFASSYKIGIGFDHIENLSAQDPAGPIIPRLTDSVQGKEISLDFNKRVVGIGNTLTFSVSFDTPDVVEKQGTVWEVNIPGIEKAQNYTQFNVQVKVPQSFGEPAYIKPQRGDKNLFFTKEDLKDSGISIAFGKKQLYSFRLLFHLRNKNLFGVSTEIAIPPDTNYQKIFIENIYPPPLDVKRDPDGNWLAQYSLGPSEKKEITVAGEALLFLKPQKELLTLQQRLLYTQEKPYWQTSQSSIKKLANELKTPRNIYNFLVNNLRYDYNRVSNKQVRAGALSALQNPGASVCLEFSDLFVALARSAGIPAREIDGFAYTKNSKERPLSLVKDVLHAWPQFYDEERQAWIMVDPTWGNTTGGVDYFDTLDFDHFAFAIKGVNSQYPVPAGGYKLEGVENQKDVHVELLDHFEIPPEILEVSLDAPKKVIAAAAAQATLVVKNKGQSLSAPQTLMVKTSLLKNGFSQVTVDEIPPFGKKTATLSFRSSSFLTNEKATVTIRMGQNTLTQTIIIAPFFAFEQFLIGGGIVASLTLLLIIAKATGRIPFSR